LQGALDSQRSALRGADRPLEARTGRSMRAGLVIGKTVSVTISIGVAERSDKVKTPDEVLRAADKALYRAKEKGRNRVSR
jgi:diguanylate cyclase (GGDEF)-like protein